MKKTITHSITRTRQPSGLILKIVATISLIIFQCKASVAQSAKPIQTVFISQGLILEKRAALRILLSHKDGNTITAYRLRDKSFLLTSSDENNAKLLRQDIIRLFPEVKIVEAVKADYGSEGFVKVTNRVTKSEPGFPQYMVTGDNELDELSYRFEKETWMNAQSPTTK